jgi:hypothetical protein
LELTIVNLYYWPNKESFLKAGYKRSLYKKKRIYQEIISLKILFLHKWSYWNILTYKFLSACPLELGRLPESLLLPRKLLRTNMQVLGRK